MAGRKDASRKLLAFYGFLAALAVLLTAFTIEGCWSSKDAYTIGGPNGTRSGSEEGQSAFLGYEAAGGAIEVVSHSSYMNYESWQEFPYGSKYSGEFFHVVGEVMNTGSTDIAYQVDVNLTDSNGNPVAGRRYWFFGASADNLAPGEKRPFLLILLNQSASRMVAEYEVSAKVQTGIHISPPWRAGFNNHVFRSDTGKVLGEIENVIGKTIEHPFVYVTFYDDTGRVIGADYDPTGIDRLAPGGSLPFELRLVYCPSAWYNSIRSYSLCASYGDSYNKPYTDLQIVEYTPEINQYGYCKIVGKVRNVGEMKAEFVQVLAAVSDSDGKMLACFSTYAQPSEIQPGQTSDFQLSESLGKEQAGRVANYRFYAYCNTYTKTESEISCGIEPDRITISNAANVTGRITPRPEYRGPVSEGVTLTFTNPQGETKTGWIRTDASSAEYRYNMKPDITGIWTVRASWGGRDDLTNATSSSISFEVTDRTDTFPVVFKDKPFQVRIVTNSSIAYFSFSASEGSIGYRASYSTYGWYGWSSSGTNGESNVTIPRALLDSPYILLIDNKISSPLLVANTTHSSLHFAHPQTSGGSAIKIKGTINELGGFPLAVVFGLCLSRLGTCARYISRHYG